MTSTKKSVLWAVIAMAVAILTGCGPVPSSGEPTEDIVEDLSGTNVIKVVNDGLCLDVGASAANGAPLVQSACSGGTSQQWTLKSAGTNIYNLISVSSGKCMDVYAASTVRGGLVDQWGCNAHTSQQWQAVSKGFGPNTSFMPWSVACASTSPERALWLVPSSSSGPATAAGTSALRSPR